MGRGDLLTDFAKLSGESVFAPTVVRTGRIRGVFEARAAVVALHFSAAVIYETTRPSIIARS